MIDLAVLDQRPVVVCIAGPNGAGKTTFYQTHIAPSGLRFVNSDVLTDELSVEPYMAARLADALRRALVSRGESFAFETVFSDPVGDKLQFLEEAAGQGYAVVLCYIGLANADISSERVAMRVSQGGHDVPRDKLLARFPRTLVNLKAAIRRLPHLLIYDNSNLAIPFRQVAAYRRGQLLQADRDIPDWLRTLMP